MKVLCSEERLEGAAMTRRRDARKGSRDSCLRGNWIDAKAVNTGGD